MTKYTILECYSNLKGDSDDLLYSVEPSDGGGIECTAKSLEEAQEYINSVGGELECII